LTAVVLPGGSTRPLARQQFTASIRLGTKAPRGLGSRAAAFDPGEPVTRRAAALETLFRADWERSAPRRHRNPVLAGENYRRARIVVEHVLAPELAAPLTLLAARYA